MSTIDELANQILTHKVHYYAGEPIISDTEYDELEEKLRKLDPDHPVLFIVGAPPNTSNVEHNPPMLSIKKALKGGKDVLDWSNKYPDIDLLVSYKTDGLSLSLTYKEGHLRQAATRGNGQKGDDVSINVMMVKAIPKVIPEMNTINIRGELYMRLSEFQRLSKTLDKEYSSPRNLAVGSLKQKDPKILANRQLNFFAFDVLGMDNYETTSAQLRELEKWGFEVPTIQVLTAVDDKQIKKIYEKVESGRSELDFQIDGLVFRYDHIKTFKKVGVTSHHPKGQIALKFTNAMAVTLLVGIEWQVGRTGVLTPVAQLEPVELAGATIRHATLHNKAYIRDKNIAIGDQVIIERAGDVIPKITGVEVKGPNSPEYPDKCPSCGSPLRKDEINIYCTGNDCREQKIQTIRYWIRITEIKHLGPRAVEQLFDENLVQQPAELYGKAINKESLVNILGKNGEKAFSYIEATRKLPFATFLAGLGIQTLGQTMGKTLAKHFSSLEALQQASIEQLSQIEGISTVTAEYIRNGVHDPDIIPKFLENNLEILYPASQPTLDANGLKVYITGSVPGYNKKQLQQFVEEHGYQWSKSISKKLDLLVIGNKAGSTKVEKAEKLGITIKSFVNFKAEAVTGKVETEKAKHDDLKSKSKSLTDFMKN